MKNLLFGLFLFVFTAPLIFAQTGEFQRGVTLYQQGKFAEAGAIFEQLIQKGNAGQEVYEGAVDCALKTSSFTKAISLIEKTIQRFGKNYSYELTLGQLYAQADNLNKSASVLQKLTSSYPDSSEPAMLLSDVYGLIGNRHYQESRYSDAITAYISSLKYNSSNKDIRRNLISAYLVLGQAAKAAETAGAGYKLHPKDNELRQIYLEALIYAENYEEALKINQIMAKEDPDNLKTQLNLALLYRYSRRADEALKVYSDLRSRYPASKEVYNAEISYLQLAGAGDTIISRYREFLANNPGDTEFMLKLGQQYERTKLYDSARVIYTELEEKDLYRDAAVLSAKTWLEEGNIGRAFELLNRYISSGGKSSEGFLELYKLHLIRNELTEAAELLRLAIERADNKVQFNILLAALYVNQKRPDDALSVLDPVRDEMKSYPEIPFLSGRIYLMKQDTSRAVTNFVRAVKYAIQSTQLLQSQLASQSAGSNIMNPDSLDLLKQTSAALDTVTTVLKESFIYLKNLTGGESFITSISGLILESPGAAILYLQRGKMYHQLGMISQAEQDFTTALSLSPNSEEMQYEAGLFFESTGNTSRAYTAYMNAWSINRKSPKLFRKVIDSAYLAGKLDAVCDYWLNIYNSNKENTLLREFLIEALHAAGRHSDASGIMKQ